MKVLRQLFDFMFELNVVTEVLIMMDDEGDIRLQMLMSNISYEIKNNSVDIWIQVTKISKNLMW